MRTRSRMARVGAWAVVWLVAGCGAGSAQGTIVATVTRGSPPVPAAGAQVTLVSTPKGSVTNGSGTAVIMNVSPGTYQVRARFIGYCESTVSVTVTAGNTTAVTLHLGSSPCAGGGRGEFGGGAGGGVEGGGGGGSGGGGGGGGGGGNDKIVTTGSTDPAILLVDIRTGNAGDPAPCENDRIVEGTGGSHDIGINALALTDPAVPCHGAAWIFTTEHAPWFDNTTATFPWTNSGGDVIATTLHANRLRVPVTIWMAGTFDKGDYQNDIKEDLVSANSFLQKHRTGLILTNSETTDNTPDIIDVATLGTAQSTSGTIGIGCDRTSDIVQTPLIYRLAQINIYVVDEVEGPGGPSGRNCVHHGAPNVIFINSKADFVTVVHEIGHALALLQPHWGHTQAIAGMHVDNIMESGATIPGHLSLGQIARMHADTRSWLNQVTGTGTVRSRQFTVAPLVTTCSCPGTEPTDDCPKISMDVPQAGMPNAGEADPACHVVTDVTCLSLPPGGTASITANGYTDTMATGFGEGTATSLAPAIVSITGTTEGFGVLTVDVRAGTTTGNTSVLLSLGGTFAKVTVKVGSSCP